jgi:hypothetical protein
MHLSAWWNGQELDADSDLNLENRGRRSKQKLGRRSKSRSCLAQLSLFDFDS